MDPNDYRIIMSKDWRRGGGVLVNVNLANHKGKFAYFFKLMVTTVDERLLFSRTQLALSG